MSVSLDDEDLRFLRRIRGSAIADGREVHFAEVLHAALEVASRHQDEVRLVLDGETR